jgi:hypothetical protein
MFLVVECDSLDKHTKRQLQPRFPFGPCLGLETSPLTLTGFVGFGLLPLYLCS